MSKHWSVTLVLLVVSLLLAGALPGHATAANPGRKIKVLVIAGGHPYSVEPFHTIFAGYSDMDCTFVEEKQGGEAFDNVAHWPYDAIVLYNFMKQPSPQQWQNFLQLLDRGVGLVILHHGIYGYRPQPEFQKIVGVTCWLTGAKDNFKMKIHVEDPQHPITRGLKDFSITDETYQGHALDPKVHVLLTTDEPTNERAIAWTHTYRKSPVCYFQLGHGPAAYTNPGFTAFLGRAIRWSAAGLSMAAGPGDDVGFRSIFDGKTLKGWHATAQTGHSRVSGNKSGGRWVVQDGAIVGSQDIPGNGGIFLTDEQFGDYEVVLEMKNDFGPDSGLFLRSDEKGTCYQAMIDYHVGGNLMGLYGEGGLGAKPNLRNFTFLDRPDHITLVTEVNNVPVPVPFPMPLEDWPKFWKHGHWNELRARIVGNPPHITTWIKGVKFMDWTETEKRHPDKGGIGLQVHGGGDFTQQFVRFRNIRVKQLGRP